MLKKGPKYQRCRKKEQNKLKKKLNCQIFFYFAVDKEKQVLMADRVKRVFRTSWKLPLYIQLFKFGLVMELYSALWQYTVRFFNLMKNDSFCHFHQNITFCICSLEISVVLIFSKKDNDTQISVVQYQNKSMNSYNCVIFRFISIPVTKLIKLSMEVFINRTKSVV